LRATICYATRRTVGTRFAIRLRRKHIVVAARPERGAAGPPQPTIDSGLATKSTKNSAGRVNLQSRLLARRAGPNLPLSSFSYSFSHGAGGLLDRHGMARLLTADPQGI
jgi:hypothetical protein